jgi:hypothetical protein
MSFQPESFTAKSSGPLSHNHLHTHTSDLQEFEIYQDTIEQSNVQIEPMTQCIPIFSPCFGPQTWAEVSHLKKKKEANLPVSAKSHFSKSHHRRSGQTLKIARRQWSVEDGALQCRLYV